MKGPFFQEPRNRRNVGLKRFNRARLFANFHCERGGGCGTKEAALEGGFGPVMTRCLTALATAFAVSLFAISVAHAVDAVNVRLDAAAIDLTAATEVQKTEGDRIQVSTAPGPDGIVRRIEVRAREGNTNWAVLALTNNSDEQIDRLIVVPHYRMVGSGIFWPDLGLSRIAAITPSTGDRPVRQEGTTADVFRITLDPGTVITLVAELRTDKLPQIYLWEPDAYKDKVNSFTLYYGIVIGIAGLLALFLTILFVVKGSIMFPAAAALGWAVLIYIGIDFGFWGKVFDMSAGAERVWRACGEAILSATLLVFLFAYLNLSRWHVRYAHITIAWLAALAALIAVAVFDPAVAAGIARMSLFGIAVFGLALVIYLSTHGFDRAVLLIPTWLLLVVWTMAAALTILGLVTNDIIGPALLGGLVLIVMLIGFTVMQHAFAGGITHGIVSDVERRALALTGAGDLIWDWDVSADKVFTSPETEHILGLKRGTLEGPAATWLEVLHPLDRDRFRASLDGMVEQRRGRLTQDLRLSTADGHYLWFTLKARPVIGSDGEVVRLVGTLTDVTDFKNAEERLLFNAVHDNLTGLPNRELFLDRMETAFGFARADSQIRPSIVVIDLDRFKQVNDSVGMAVGDSILPTIARRLSRLLKPQDTLARLSGDQFALIVLSEREPARIVAFAETIRRTLRAPIAYNDREIFLTASIGLALAENAAHRTDEVLKDAELAMYYAKRIGGDRIEIFKPAMRSRKTDRLTMESELRRAIEREEIKVLYQPIVRLEDRAIAGFEALARWDHPKLGRLSPKEFISIAEEIGLIVDLGLFVLDHTAKQLAQWQAATRAREPVFASVNVSSRQLLRHDLIQDLRGVLGRTAIARGTLKLEITESLVMENPEHAAQMLTRIKELGAGLSLDDFGTGHSSLAYLQRFPFDTIKIDQSFVRTTARGTRPVILRSIIALAHDLGMEVVAEGAETDSDAVELYQLGCEYAQGFAFGEPMTSDAARDLLVDKPSRLRALKIASE
jgi:diguanylate cyclase (GGDEF)-like protein/PAS domain S-box-containing protein